MALIPKVSATRSYIVRGDLLNALIDAANSWQNLRVELVVSSEEVTRLIRAAGGATLRIAIPPSGGGGGLPEGVVWEEFTICDSGSPATRWLPTSTTDPTA